MKHRFTVRSVFGWVKSVGGLRQTMVRGLAKVNLEFNLQIIATNILMTTRSMQCQAYLRLGIFDSCFEALSVTERQLTNLSLQVKPGNWRQIDINNPKLISTD